MNRFRRPAADGDPRPELVALGDDHARAIALAAQAPTEPPGPIDAAWLTAHLAVCSGCRGTAEAYEADRLLLRGLRERAPRAPRDLWARTRVALEREEGRTVRVRRASLPPRTPARGQPPAATPRPDVPYRQPSWTPGILGGLMVVAILMAASLLNGLGPVLPSSSAQPSGPGATPISVLADVGWIQTGTNGAYDVYLTQIDRVCPLGDPSACGPLQDTARTSITLGSRPTSVSRSPSSGQLVVVSSGTSSGSSVLVVPVPTAANPRPTATPALVASPRPGSTGVTPGASPAGTSPAPSGAGSPPPSGVGPLPSASAETAGAIAIAEGVIVVGGSAAYSPDGLWFAFAARPADGSAGPDIHVWHVGDARAQAVTTDHRSVFSGWLGNQILGSRVEAASDGPARPAGSRAPAASVSPSGTTSASAPAASRVATPGPAASNAPSNAPAAGPSGGPVAGEARAVSFLLDPATRERRDLASPYFRPVVDATGRWVVYWEGTLAPSHDGLEWRPATGRLVVAPWSSALGAAGQDPAASAVPVASPAASASPASGRISQGAASPSAPASAPSAVAAKGSPAPASSSRPGASLLPAVPEGLQEILPGPLADFDGQFDPTGTHLAVWTASQADLGTGFLSLYVLTDGTWTLDPGRRLVATPALRGFAIGQGELAWVTPPGADGHGSHIAVLGWTADGVGSVESVPGDSLLVIR